MLTKGMDYYIPASPKHIQKERNKAKALRQSQWWKQKLAQGVCHYCNEQFSKPELTMDHIVPVARGGSSTKGNVVVCCKSCNSLKAHKVPAELISTEE